MANMKDQTTADGKGGDAKGSATRTIAAAGFALLLVLYFKEALGVAATMYGAVFPLLLGAAIAYVLDILVTAYEKILTRKKSGAAGAGTRRGLGILFALLTVAAAVFIFLRLIIPQIRQFVDLLVAMAPALYDRLLHWAERYADYFPALREKIAGLDLDVESIVQKSFATLTVWAGGTVSLVGNLFSSIMNILIALIFSIYILFGKSRLTGTFRKLSLRYLNEGAREKLNMVLKTADESFSSFIVGQLKEALILGTLCVIGMYIFKFPYPTAIGTIVGLTALVPIVGAYMGAGVGFLLILVSNPLKAFFFLIFIVALQQTEGNLIYPRVVGKSIGLPGIWVLVAITIGGGLFGIAGVMFGVPVFATCYKLLGRSVAAPIDS